MLNKFRRFFREYRHLGLVVLAIIIGGVLDLANKDGLSHLVLGFTALISLVPILKGMFEDLRTGSYGLDVLAITAVVTSVLLHEYWAGIVIILMLTGGEALEDYAERRAKRELTTLLARKPKLAHLVKGSNVVDIKASAVNPDDRLAVYPGEVIPVDCEIIEGATYVDESSLTGESLPVEKQVGDELLSGSLNTDGSITVRALHSAADSQYQQIIKLVQSASANQSPFVRLADRYSVPFTVLSFLIAGSAWVVSGDPVRFLEVIVVATPCPLLLGAPIALISGMSRQAKHGIIVKTGSAMERLAEVRAVGFDKTGTLTYGRPKISGVTSFNGFTKDEVLVNAAALEQHSTHILANAILTEVSNKSLKLPKVKLAKEFHGRGLSGRLQGKTILVGRSSLLSEHDIDITPSKNKVLGTATYVAIGNKLAGVIGFEDEIRSDSKSMLSRLKKLGIKQTIMVTGDSAVTANKVGKFLGITSISAECLPADKLHVIEAVKVRPLAFVGDGLNDAPVLTTADVGIALGARGSTAASESADVVILDDKVSKVADSISIAKHTFSIARQSILIGIFMSIGLMAVFSTGKFRAVHGAALQEVVDIAVIINALRAHLDKKLT